MRRKLPGEKVKKLRHADKEQIKSLRGRCLRFANDRSAAVRVARPHTPETLNDRAADNWEPFLAIADLAGGDWPERARVAAQALSRNSQTDDSVRVLLLADIREVFAEKRADRIATEDLLKALVSMEERPWAEFKHGKPLTASQLANLLRQFDIQSRSVRFGPNNTPKGYTLDRFKDAFTRYLPASEPPQRHNTIEQGNSSDSTAATSSPCGGSESSDTAYETSRCGVVADETPLAGGEMHGLTVANLEKGAGSDQLSPVNPDDAQGA